MLVTVTVSRAFTAGSLVGLVIEQRYSCDATLAPKVGDKRVVAKPIGGGAYVDTVLAVNP